MSAAPELDNATARALALHAIDCYLAVLGDPPPAPAEALRLLRRCRAVKELLGTDARAHPREFWFPADKTPPKNYFQKSLA